MRTKILIVGGYGQVGRIIAARLGHLFPGIVIAAGRSAARAEALAQQTHGRVVPLQLDIAALEGNTHWLDDVRLVIMCLEHSNELLARACLERGIDYIDISASYPLLRAIERLDPIARDNHATAVLSVGLTPGLTNLLARYFVDLFDSTQQIDISVRLGLGEAHGADAIRWTLANADRRFAIRTAEGTQWVESFTKPRRTLFAGDTRSQLAYHFDFADQHVLPTTLGIPQVTTWLCFDSPGITQLIAVLKQTGALRYAQRVDPKWVSRLAGSMPFGSDRFSVRVDVLGSKEGKPIAGVGFASGRGEAQATGIITALVAERLYTAPTPAGVFHSEQLFRPLEILRKLPGESIEIALDIAHPIPIHATLGDWIARAALRFSADAPESLHAAVDQLIAALDDSVELLGLGEALHGGEDILVLRNRLFQRLVEAHGYSAIAVESSFPRGRLVNEYIAGRGAASYEAVQESGFSHGFGRLDANRELVEWMRRYNADPAHLVKLRFYGFDSPTEMYATDSPSYVLHAALDYLAAIDSVGGQKRRERIDALLGSDADWENPAALMDPTKSIGLSPAASALRIETEDLITELQIRRPELVAKSDADRYWEALQYTTVARQLLNYHAALARDSDHRVAELLGIRDAMMADNLTYIVSRERGRGKVLAFAHNQHLKRGKVAWQLGPHMNIWWPAGAHLNELFGPRYVVIGSGLGVSEANGIGQPEAGTLEASLTSLPEPALFIPTHKSQGLPGSEIAALPTRSGSSKNPSYFALTPESFTDFDWLAVLASTTYSRGGPPLP